jgi:hypothetical protein
MVETGLSDGNGKVALKKKVPSGDVQYWEVLPPEEGEDVATVTIQVSGSNPIRYLYGETDKVGLETGRKFKWEITASPNGGVSFRRQTKTGQAAHLSGTKWFIDDGYSETPELVDHGQGGNDAWTVLTKGGGTACPLVVTLKDPDSGNEVSVFESQDLTQEISVSQSESDFYCIKPSWKVLEKFALTNMDDSEEEAIRKELFQLAFRVVRKASHTTSANAVDLELITMFGHFVHNQPGTHWKELILTGHNGRQIKAFSYPPDLLQGDLYVDKRLNGNNEQTTWSQQKTKCAERNPAPSDNACFDEYRRFEQVDELKAEFQQEYDQAKEQAKTHIAARHAAHMHTTGLTPKEEASVCTMKGEGQEEANILKKFPPGQSAHVKKILGSCP